MNAQSHKHLIGGSLLVAGTAIGAGMLALPVVTGAGGFWPALLVYALCWIFMTITGLFLLELCLKMPEEANIPSIVSKYLGRWGKFFSWILYLFLFYSLSIAYVSSGGSLISEALSISPWSGSLLFMLVFSTFVYIGAWVVDRLNLFLMAGLIVSFFFFVFIAVPHVQGKFLLHGNLPKAFLALPVIFTSFSYQGVIPTLTTYLKRDKKRLRLAIISGTTIAFLIYFLWEVLILGTVPVDGEHGLLAAKMKGETAIDPLRYQFSGHKIFLVGQFFSFFAITTSYLGVTLGLFDFFSDGLNLAKKKGKNRFLIWAITFLPPTFVAIANPHVFLIALSYAGGIGCAILLGLFPSLMIWVSRFHRKEKAHSVLPISRIFLILLYAFVAFELIIEGIQEFLRLTG